MTHLLRLERRKHQWKHPTRKKQSEETNCSKLGCWKTSLHKVKKSQMWKKEEGFSFGQFPQSVLSLHDRLINKTTQWFLTMIFLNNPKFSVLTLTMFYSENRDTHSLMWSMEPAQNLP